MKKRNDPSTCKIIKVSIQTISIPSVEESRYSAESLLDFPQSGNMILMPVIHVPEWQIIIKIKNHHHVKSLDDAKTGRVFMT